MDIINEDLMLEVLATGGRMVWISELSGWPNRQIRAFGARNGYLFDASGAPYRPPGPLR